MIRSCLFGCLLFLFCFQAADAQSVPRNRVLAIGIDGTRFDALTKAKTPNLDELMQNGAWTDNTQILGERYQKNDTISGPGWSSYLTGVWADKHGVHDNSFEGRNYGPFPHFFKYVKEHYPRARTASFVDWEPIHQFIVSNADVNQVYPAHGPDEYTTNDAKIAADAAALLTEDDPHAVMVYFGAVDETGHRFGFHPDVEQYVAAIETVDEHVGELVAALKSRKGYANENWLIVVSTDHGGQGLGHGGGHSIAEIRTTFLIVSGAAARQGKIEEQTYVVDLPVTALTHLGVQVDPDWKLDGRSVGLKALD